MDFIKLPNYPPGYEPYKQGDDPVKPFRNVTQNMYRNMTRKGGIPYIEHFIRIDKDIESVFSERADFSKSYARCLGYSHDWLEDSYDELTKGFHKNGGNLNAIWYPRRPRELANAPEWLLERMIKTSDKHDLYNDCIDDGRPLFFAEEWFSPMGLFGEAVLHSLLRLTNTSETYGQYLNPLKNPPTPVNLNYFRIIESIDKVFDIHSNSLDAIGLAPKERRRNFLEWDSYIRGDLEASFRRIEADADTRKGRDDGDFMYSFDRLVGIFNDITKNYVELGANKPLDNPELEERVSRNLGYNRVTRIREINKSLLRERPEFELMAVTESYIRLVRSANGNHAEAGKEDSRRIPEEKICGRIDECGIRNRGDSRAKNKKGKYVGEGAVSPAA